MKFDWANKFIYILCFMFELSNRINKYNLNFLNGSPLDTLTEETIFCLLTFNLSSYFCLNLFIRGKWKGVTNFYCILSICIWSEFMIGLALIVLKFYLLSLGNCWLFIELGMDEKLFEGSNDYVFTLEFIMVSCY